MAKLFTIKWPTNAIIIITVIFHDFPLFSMIFPYRPRFGPYRPRFLGPIDPVLWRPVGPAEILGGPRVFLDAIGNHRKLWESKGNY